MSTYKTIDYTYEERRCGYPTLKINNSDVRTIDKSELVDLILNVRFPRFEDCDVIEEGDDFSSPIYGFDVDVEFADGSSLSVYIVYSLMWHRSSCCYIPSYFDDESFEIDEIRVAPTRGNDDELVAGMDDDGLIEFTKLFKNYADTIAYYACDDWINKNEVLYKQ
jgi:hypothetical protein